MKLLRENLFVKFSLYSFVAMVVIAAGLIIFISNLIHSYAVTALIADAEGHAGHRVLSVLEPGDLEGPMTGDRYRQFDSFVRTMVVDNRTARLKVWAKDGTIVYSTEPSQIGQQFTGEHARDKALRGITTAEPELPDTAETASERALGALMAVYTPITFSGSDQPSGALEIYQFYDETAQRIETARRQVAAIVGIGFLLLYGALAGTVWRGWCAIVEQRRTTEQMQKEKERVEAQFRQAQKMDAIGRLAGGIAHDFNNFLTVITMGIDMLTARLPHDNTTVSNAEELKKATQKAAALTRQLLSFSRQEPVSRQDVDANNVVTEMKDMLGRLIGMNVQLVTDLAPHACAVHADRGGLEQVLMNLVINARDAMPDGGSITLRTNLTFMPLRGSEATGDYVSLAVTDTGTGMDQAVLDHLFEPFFTTKPRGKGTGLGLSTVYSIVKQNDGWVDVQSAPGNGTTFNVYLPAVIAAPATAGAL